MKGFTKFIWIVFFGTIAYNIFIGIHLGIVYAEQEELRLAMNGVRSEALKGMSMSDIKIRFLDNFWLINKLETFNFIFLFTNGVMGISLLIRNWNYLMMRKRIKGKTPFVELSKEAKENILFDNFCDNCAEKKETIFKEEKLLLGTPYIIVHCKTCGYEIKIKDSW